jgi:hypothetical protein
VGAARTAPLRAIASASEAIQLACVGSWIASSLSLLAMTRRYPPPRSETERGRGTMRSMVEGAYGAAAGREAQAPSTALTRGPPSPLRGAG